jgi:hypothetical protein
VQKSITKSGLLLVDKPEGPSSAHVVHRAKVSLGAKKVGHLGTSGATVQRRAAANSADVLRPKKGRGAAVQTGAAGQGSAAAAEDDPDRFY